MTIIYMSLGGVLYSLEASYSILTALRFLKDRGEPCRVVVYTDTPSAFEGMPVEVVALSPAKIRNWKGEHNFIHRAKVLCLMEAIVPGGGRYLYLDSDTYFKRDPRLAFRKVGPGASVMHVREGTLYSWGAEDIARLVADRPLSTIGHGPLAISPFHVTWNAGVIGLDAADVGLLAEVLNLTDIVYGATRSMISEQFAFSVVLEQFTKRSETFDVVHHYWHESTKRAFRDLLPHLMTETAELPEVERLRRLWANRPIEPLRWRLPFRVKLAAKRLGLFRKGLTSPAGQTRG